MSSSGNNPSARPPRQNNIQPGSSDWAQYTSHSASDLAHHFGHPPQSSMRAEPSAMYGHSSSSLSFQVSSYQASALNISTPNPTSFSEPEQTDVWIDSFTQQHHLSPMTHFPDYEHNMSQASPQPPTSSTPYTPPELVLSRPLSSRERTQLTQLDALRLFLLTAPTKWGSSVPSTSSAPPPPALHRFQLPGSEVVSCVRWRGLFYITGTDVVRALVFRFAAFGRPIKHMKKFEEGVFSDLRNLKPGLDATLEDPKSPFLDLLFKHQCIRTQKKQKVFLWFSVPHDRLFLDALERDLKRERAGQESTSEVTGEPAQSFVYDPSRPLQDHFRPPAPSTSLSSLEEPGLLTRFAGVEGPTGYKQRRPNRVKGRRSDVHSPEGSPESESEPLPAPTPSHTHMGYGYSAYDQDLTAADMFSRQASGVFAKQLRDQKADAARRKEELRERKEREELIRRQELGRASAEEQAKSIRERLVREKGSVAQHSEVVEVDEVVTSSTFSGPTMDDAAAPYMTTRTGYSSPAMSTHELSGPGMSGNYPVYSHQPTHSSALASAATSSSSSSATDGGRTSNSPPIDGKLFPCPLFSCGRAFKRAEHLRRHLRTHTAERPFVCQVCDKRFARSDNLAQHMRTHARAAAQAGMGHQMENAEVEYAGLAGEGMAWAMGNGSWDEMDEEMSEGSSGMSVSGAGDETNNMWSTQNGGAAPSPQRLADLRLASSSNALAFPLNGHTRSGSSSSEGGQPMSAPSALLAFDPSSLGPPSSGSDSRRRSLTPSYPEGRRSLTGAVRDRSSVHGTTAYSPYAHAALSHARSLQSSPAPASTAMGSYGASSMVRPDYSADYASAVGPSDYNNYALMHQVPPHSATYPPPSNGTGAAQHVPRAAMSYSEPSTIDQYSSAPAVNIYSPSTYGVPGYSSEPENILYDSAPPTNQFDSFGQPTFQYQYATQL